MLYPWGSQKIIPDIKICQPFCLCHFKDHGKNALELINIVVLRRLSIVRKKAHNIKQPVSPGFAFNILVTVQGILIFPY
jgi:hypothetical protein